jgi:hypothetical protein
MIENYPHNGRDPITSGVIDPLFVRDHLRGMEPHRGSAQNPRRKTMSPISNNTALTNILLLDAATCVAAGALMAFGSNSVADLTAIPAPLLTWAGLILFPVAALMAYAGLQASPPRPLVRLIILGNIGWVATSLAVFAFIAPNALGYVFITAQAAAVAVLALLEHSALQRSGAALA